MTIISIITVFPELYTPFISTSLIARAIENKFITFNIVQLSDLCPPKSRIDSPTCGPGSGMVLKPELIETAIDTCEQKHGKGFKIFFSPQGKILNQRLLQECAQQLFIKDNLHDDKQKTIDNHIILVCGRYEGFDARVEQEYADLLLSIGDYILMGGDLPAQVFLEGILRLIPGIIGKQESVENDSFSGPLLDYPTYTQPISWHGKEVPVIVTSGDHAKITAWRTEQAYNKTLKNRFDWFTAQQLSPQNIEIAHTMIPNHYVTVMHTQVNIKDGRVGHSSIASLDIHDIARSSKTYGIENYFIISPLEDQQKLLSSFLNFWRSNEGKKYNQSRFDAMALVQPAHSLDEVIEAITQKEGKPPIIIATSAKKNDTIPSIDYFSQSIIWKKERPVLFLFGTGQGLSDEVLNRSDYLLLPINGLSNYNHLSVRAAATVILDRWLGLHPRTSSWGLKNDC